MWRSYVIEQEHTWEKSWHKDNQQKQMKQEKDDKLKSQCTNKNCSKIPSQKKKRTAPNLSWIIVTPPSIAAFTPSVIERPHFRFILESVTAYRNRSVGSNGLCLCNLGSLFFSFKRWSKGPWHPFPMIISLL